jgi:hypothetical protein
VSVSVAIVFKYGVVPTPMPASGTMLPF